MRAVLGDGGFRDLLAGLHRSSSLQNSCGVPAWSERRAAEEVVARDRLGEEEVVVGVDEELAQPRDPVEVDLDGLGVVCRQMGTVWEDVLMPHEADLPRLLEPARKHAVRDDEDGPNPRQEHQGGSQ